jgi:hypothetical protein
MKSKVRILAVVGVLLVAWAYFWGGSTMGMIGTFGVMISSPLHGALDACRFALEESLGSPETLHAGEYSATTKLDTDESDIRAEIMYRLDHIDGFSVQGNSVCLLTVFPLESVETLLSMLGLREVYAYRFDQVVVGGAPLEASELYALTHAFCIQLMDDEDTLTANTQCLLVAEKTPEDGAS